MSTCINTNTTKKVNSTSNSITNTPSSTPISTTTNTNNTQAPLQSTTPPNNAPKYGTLVPNRIFVGGISANTTEAELLQLFSNYGTVKAAKIIQDRAGVSRGYGFVTFETEEDAKRLQREADNIVLRERKLNIAPAIKKQPFGRAFDAPSPSAITPGASAPYFIPAAGMPFYQSGMTYYSQAPPPGDPNVPQAPVYQPPAVYPGHSGPPQTAGYPSLVYPTQPLYMPQQFPYQPVPYDYSYYANGAPQYMLGNQSTSQSQGPPMQRPPTPPRTPLYNNSTMPYGVEGMYYNVPPMYANPLEAAPVYQQDPMELANGNMNEEPYGFYGTKPIELKPPHPSNMQDFSNTSSSPADPTRQSNTPVVSVLSLDQHQERDFTSLQSGRRQKTTDNIPSPNNIPDYNNRVVVIAYENSFLNSNRNTLQPINNSNNFSGMWSALQAPKDFGGSSQIPPVSNGNFGGNDRSLWYNKKRTSNYNTENALSQSETLNYVDENRNEEKNFRTNENTPTPPPPPIPSTSCPAGGMTTNKFAPRSYQGTTVRSTSNVHLNNNSIGNPSRNMSRNFPPRNLSYHNSYRNNQNNIRRSEDFRTYSNKNNRFKMKDDHHVPATTTITTTTTHSNSVLDSSNANASAGNLSLENLKLSFPIESNTTLTSLPPQIPSLNFIPPARRGGRRSLRRGHCASSPNEIGAGDAPLPSSSSDVSDPCKLLDNLKL